MISIPVDADRISIRSARSARARRDASVEDDDASRLALVELLAPLSRALDLTEGQPAGHAQRTCLIGLRIADAIGLAAADKSDLLIALLLKDAGCASNAARMFAIFGGDERIAKRDGKICDWCSPLEAIKYGFAHTAPHAPMRARFRKVMELARFPGRVMDALTAARCSEGAEIARTLGLSDAVAETIYHLDEHFDGRGAPHGRRGDEIPIGARIACLAQTLEVFHATYGLQTALQTIGRRRGTWFDPSLVDSVNAFANDTRFWDDLRERSGQLLDARLCDTSDAAVGELGLDTVCESFARIVDAKSPYTGGHSRRVARYAEAIGENLNLGPAAQNRLRRAGLLHDLGKLGVPNVVLQKPDRLSADEWRVVRLHPQWTSQILDNVPALSRLRRIAEAHHERLDGGGYFLGMNAPHLDTEMRALAVADVYDALAAERPYREALPAASVREILLRDAGVALDGDCVDAIVADSLAGDEAPTPFGALFDETRSLLAA